VLGHFIEASVNFQNDTIWLMYSIIAACAFGIAALMFITAQNKQKK